jgi:hypothetical protein
VLPDYQITQDFRAWANVDMAFKCWSTLAVGPNSDTLHQEAIGADLCVRMDYDPGRVG